ncbi:MAG: M48 family metalloprotease [Anaerolineales bacterium]|nr:M48 family metalloprotease [Anaerolineales bacterium]
MFELGLPLAAILQPQELVALIGHELGHLAAGDPQRHWLIGSIVAALANWYDALHPKSLWASRPSFIETVYAFFANIVLVALAGLIWPALWALSLLLWRESQRAEYRADQIAATLAGRTAVASLLRKLGRADQIHEVVKARALASRLREGARDLITHIGDLDWRVPDGPPSEAEAGYVADCDIQADASHPPLAYRLDLLYRQAQTGAELTLTRAEFDAIQAEIHFEAPRIEAQLIDRYLSRI